MTLSLTFLSVFSLIFFESSSSSLGNACQSHLLDDVNFPSRCFYSFSHRSHQSSSASSLDISKSVAAFHSGASIPPRPLTPHIFKAFLIDIWKLERIDDVIIQDDGHLLVRCTYQHLMLQVLEDRPWSFTVWLFVVDKWTEPASPQFLSQLPRWIKILNVPHEYHYDDALRETESVMGLIKKIRIKNPTRTSSREKWTPPVQADNQDQTVSQTRSPSDHHVPQPVFHQHFSSPARSYFQSEILATSVRPLHGFRPSTSLIPPTQTRGNIESTNSQTSACAPRGPTVSINDIFLPPSNIGGSPGPHVMFPPHGYIQSPLLIDPLLTTSQHLHHISSEGHVETSSSDNYNTPVQDIFKDKLQIFSPISPSRDFDPSTSNNDRSVQTFWDTTDSSSRSLRSLIHFWSHNRLPYSQPRPPDDIVYLMILLIWRIWEVRNAKRSSLPFSAQQAITEFNVWNHIQKPSYSTRVPTSSNMSMAPSSFSKFSCLTDASWHVQDSCFGFGWVLETTMDRKSSKIQSPYTILQNSNISGETPSYHMKWML